MIAVSYTHLVVCARKPLRHFCHLYAQFDRIAPGSTQHLRILAGADDSIPVTVHRDGSAGEKVCLCLLYTSRCV